MGVARVASGKPLDVFRPKHSVSFYFILIQNNYMISEVAHKTPAW